MKLIQWLTPLRTRLLVVALPVVLTAGYQLLLAEDRFVSEAEVALRESGSGGAAQLPGAALLTGLVTPSREDTLLLQAYVHSLTLLKTLDTDLGLRGHYGSPSRDVVSRLSKTASQEDLLAYYRGRVSVQMDDFSSALKIRVQGFEPAFAQRLNQAILDESERFVNEFSQKMARERLAFAEGELQGAGERLQAAKARVLAFQAKHNLLNATAEAEAAGALIADLTAQITRAETELRGLQGYLNENAYQVRALRSQIAAMRAQLAAERQRAVGGGKGNARINALSAEFQGLQMQADFALDAYKLALSAVENARIDASRKLKSLVVVQAPSLPETAELPRRLYNIATVLIVSLLLYGALRLTLATIREHQD